MGWSSDSCSRSGNPRQRHPPPRQLSNTPQTGRGMGKKTENKSRNKIYFWLAKMIDIYSGTAFPTLWRKCLLDFARILKYFLWPQSIPPVMEMHMDVSSLINISKIWHKNAKKNLKFQIGQKVNGGDKMKIDWDSFWPRNARFQLNYFYFTFRTPLGEEKKTNNIWMDSKNMIKKLTAVMKINSNHFWQENEKLRISAHRPAGFFDIEKNTWISEYSKKWDSWQMGNWLEFFLTLDWA